MLNSADRSYRLIGCLALSLAATAAVANLAVAAGTSYGPLPAAAPAQPSLLDARITWQTNLPAGQTVLFSSYDLVDGRIYAIGTDGVVIAVRADNGEVSWVRQIAREGETLFPPVAVPFEDGLGVAFAHLHDVEVFNAKNGVPVSHMDSSMPIRNAVAIAPGRVFLFHTGGHLAAFRLKDAYIYWRASFDDLVDLPPVFIPTLNYVVAVDESGLVAGLKNIDRTERRVAFKIKLRSRPAGEPTIDGSMMYLSTENQTLHAIDMDSKTAANEPGQIVWQYRLAGTPDGSPIVTKNAIYQTMKGSGLQRLAKVPGEFRGWFDPQAKQFLAEWPNGVVVLRDNGTLALIDGDPAHPVAIADAEGLTQGISNPWNDAVYLVNPRGLVRCIRPTEAAPLEMASFLSPAGPMKRVAEREPAIDKLRREAQARRDKREGRTPPSEINVSAAPAQADAVGNTAEAAAARDPFKTNIPFVQ